MKTPAWLIAIIIATLVAPVSAIAEDIPVVNGGFESAATDADPVPGWKRLQHAGQRAFSMTSDASEHAEGKQSFRIERTAKVSFGMIWQAVAAETLAGRKMNYSAQLKTSEIGPRGVVLVATFMRGAAIGTQVRSEPVTGTQEWSKVQIDAEVPAHTTSIKLGVMLLDAGTAWADSIKLSMSGKAKSAAKTPPAANAVEPAKAAGSKRRNP